MINKKDFKREFAYFLAGIITISLFIICLVSLGVPFDSPKKTIINQYYATENITLLIDRIAQNCGSTFISKEYNSDKYSVLVEDCNSNNYCKFIYKDLNDCIGGK